MSLLFAPMILAAAEPVAEAPADQDIVVIGNRLRNWRGSWRMNEGGVTCRTSRSTGDKAVDAVGCDAMVACIAPIAPRFAAIEAAKLSKAEAQQQADALLQAEKIGDCLGSRREAGIAALVAARRSKRS